jgi:hypothetical protein
MMRLAAIAMLSLALTACAVGGGGGQRQGRLPPDLAKPAASPSAIVAAEIRFAQLAKEKGQWTAFRETMAPGAQMVDQGLVAAAAYLNGRADPPQAAEWQVHKVVMSCDGSLAASTGAWQGPAGAQGAFVTIWQRQPGGEYKWLFDHGWPLAAPLSEPDFVTTELAKCRRHPLPVQLRPNGSFATNSGVSADGSMAWSVDVLPADRIVIRLLLADVQAMTELPLIDTAAVASQ